MKDSTEIANEFIRRAMTNNTHLTQMQLQKLVYIAHGWYLAIHDTALISDSCMTFNYGPAYPQLLDALKQYGSKPVTETIRVIGKEVVANLSKDQSTFIDEIYNKYAAFHAHQLSSLTHENDSPWYKKYIKEAISRCSIDNLSIKKQFTEIAHGN